MRQQKQPKAGKASQQQDDPEQSKRILDAAREAEADETANGEERAFKAVVKPRKGDKDGR
jgi:hypothetical protein